MNKKTCAIFAILISLSGLTYSQKDTVINKTDPVIVTGYCTITDIKNGKTTSEWFAPEYSSYSPEIAVIESLKPFAETGHTITIVLGTWCGDSKEQFPRFVKILNAMEFDELNLNIICVDRQKKAEGIPLETYNILKVPTIIVYKDEEELGRIVETPEITLEKDLLKLLSK